MEKFLRFKIGNKITLSFIRTLLGNDFYHTLNNLGKTIFNLRPDF